MATEPNYPSFAEAVDQLVAFLHQQGHPVELLFLTADQLLLAKGRWFIRSVAPESTRSTAQVEYDLAVSRPLGVGLIAQCVVGGKVGVSVGRPSDEEQAERLMYPNGLKLSVAEPLQQAEVLDPSRWAELKVRMEQAGHDTRVDPELLM